MVSPHHPIHLPGYSYTHCQVIVILTAARELDGTVTMDLDQEPIPLNERF